jgi:hypothetical protein
LEQWGELEIAYASALDRGEPLPDATDPILRTAANRLIALVRARVQLLDHPE